MPYVDLERRRTCKREWARRNYAKIVASRTTPAVLYGVKDLTGQTFNRLTVLDKTDRRTRQGSGGNIYWRCSCACGKICYIAGYLLTKGKTKSCGCWRREIAKSVKTTHGHTRGYRRTKEYGMLMSARTRAKRDGIVCDIQIEDIIIPDKCPLLGVPFDMHATRFKKSLSPSLDRKNPKLGYTKDNIWVISYRANTVKSDLTLQELEVLVANLRTMSASAIGEPERFIISVPALDPLPVKEQPVRVPESLPEPEEVPAGGE
jgi:hypothetical protein